MSPQPREPEYRVLIVEDAPTDAELMERELRNANLRVSCRRVDSRDLLRRLIPEFQPDVVLSDYHLPGFGGDAALSVCQELCPDVPFLVVAGSAGDEVAADLLKRGAVDYVHKDRLARLGSAVTRAVLEAKARAERLKAEGERAQLAEQLRQAQKMEAVGRLAGGVAHDFNNILTIIGGYGDMLLSSLPVNDPLRAYAQQILEAGEKAAALTRQLLAFSRKQILKPAVLDLNVVVTDMQKMLQRLLGEDVQLSTRLAPDLGRVKADRGQIEQVIMNLAVNARDAMPKGGTITIETANADLDASYAARHAELKPGGYVLLAISDTGVGMNEETKAHLFEPFFTTKEVGKGTGLGLSTVYGIVRQSEGHIWVYSEPGRGATFKIYLPRTDEKPRPAKEESSTELPIVRMQTVLVVEDADVIRRLACEVLQMHGYTVIEAPNGSEALKVSSEHKGPIHLLLTDVVMPGMSGRELATRLATKRPGTKVLYVSGYTQDAIVHHGVLDPGTPFLEKPYSPNALVRKVREVLEAPPGAV